MRAAKLVHELLPERGAALFEQLAVFYPDIDFPEQPASTHRYHYENDFYPYGDAIILAAMMRHFQPRRIVEVGSGFSSAVMLDTLQRARDLSETRLTFIDPNDERLQTILRPEDRRRTARGTPSPGRATCAGHRAAPR